MVGYIYKTTNLINGKIYIGQHLAKKFEPEKYKGSGVLLKKAMQEYGWENFSCELLVQVEDIELLDELEIFYIKKYRSRDSDIDYNLCPGGNTSKGYKFTPAQRLKTSIAHLGLKQSSEAVQKQAAKMRGRTTITNGVLVRIVPAEELAEYYAQGWYKGRLKNARSQAVVCFETGEIFPSISQARLKHPTAYAIWRCVHNWEYKATCGGFHWYLLEDEERKKWLHENIKH